MMQAIKQLKLLNYVIWQKNYNLILMVSIFHHILRFNFDNIFLTYGKTPLQYRSSIMNSNFKNKTRKYLPYISFDFELERIDNAMIC